MKKINISVISLLFGAAILGSCSENSWNDHLDGFVGGTNFNTAVDVEYQLSSADYKKIAQLLMATTTSPSDSAVAKAIQINRYFDNTSIYPDTLAIPYLLDQTDTNFFIYPDGSTVSIPYAYTDTVPQELYHIMGSLTYTFRDSDYENVYGYGEVFVPTFTPDKTAADYIPGFLSEKFPEAEAGQFAILTYNTASQNPMWGYPENATGALANLYTESTLLPGQYILAGPNRTTSEDLGDYVVACNLASNYSYGYLPSSQVKLDGEIITSIDPANQIFIFEDAGREGEFYIKDISTDRYYYQSGNYNSFNVSASLPDDESIINFVWVVSAEENNSWKIFNKGVEKWIQLPYGNYSTWGSYSYSGGDSSDNNYPYLYVVDQSIDSAPDQVLYVPSYTTENAIYYFNGKSWDVPTGVEILNPDDYTAMGFGNNRLSDPQIYGAAYLKHSLPYAQSGDEIFLAYNIGSNSCACSFFIYDGANWNLNDNGKVNVVGVYKKTGGKWYFDKYMGSAIYDEFNEEEIILDRQYLIVGDGVCATPLAASYNYGYLLGTPVNPEEGHIVLPNANNGFTFASSYEIDGDTFDTPEGLFVIKDYLGRYVYMSGNFASFNVTTNPDLSVPTNGFFFSAEKQDDGTWAISNDRGENGGKRTIFFSSKYSNFAGYAEQTENDMLPSLYILEEE